jgi:hypothetical protein
MTESKSEVENSKDTKTSKPSDGKVKNISGIQGLDQDVTDFTLWKEKYKAHENEDLAEDLEKFRDRPKPAFIKDDGLTSEVQSQINNVKERRDLHASSALEKMQEIDSGWTEPVKAMQDDKAKPFTTMETMESFPEPPKVKISDGEGEFNRYYGGNSQKNNRWLTRDHLDTPEYRKQTLALPENNTAEYEAKFKIEKGATFLEGKTAPRNDLMGGGNQIFVLDQGALLEV